MNTINEIPTSILKKYDMLEMDVYKKDFGDNLETEMMFYHTFLLQTDHIPNKIIEKQIMGENTEDYSDILNYRQFCRDKINELNDVLFKEE